MTTEDHGRTATPTDEEADEDRGRFLAFSDGVFAFAATLLVVTLTAPAVQRGHFSELPQKLLDLWPQALAYAISFLVVSRFWAVHRQLFRRIRRLDGALLGMNTGTLLLVAALPFPTSVLGLYGTAPVAVALYAGTLTAIGLFLLAIRLYALSKTLMRRDPTPGADRTDTLRAALFPLLFVSSIPIAYIGAPSHAVFSWLLLIPLNMALNRLAGRQSPHRASRPAR